MTTPEDKRIKKVFKKFLKQHKQFKETSDIINYDVAVVFDKTDLKTFYVVIHNDFRETNLTESDDSYIIFYLKNTNPHDVRRASRGFISRVEEKSCMRNYTQ